MCHKPRTKDKLYYFCVNIYNMDSKVYIFLADGFEELEALAPLDILRRANHECRDAGVV